MDAQQSEYISVGEFRSRLRERGVVVTAAQLARWRRQGLMTDAIQCGAGRGAGSITYISVRQLERAIAILQSLSHSRNFDSVRWSLWINGGGIAAEHWRRQLLVAAEQFDSCVSMFKDILDDDDDDKLEHMFLGLFAAPIKIPFFVQMRKRLGRDRFGAFFYEIMRIGAGEFDDLAASPDPNDIDRRRTTKIMDAGLGLTKARMSHIPAIGPVIAGDYAPTLSAMSDLFASKTMTQAIRDMSDDAMEQAKAEWFALLRILAAGSTALEAQFGRGAFGLRTAASLLLIANRNVQAMCVIAWATMRNDPKMRGQTDALLTLAFAPAPASLGV